MSGTDVITIPIRDRETGTIAFKRWQDCEDIIENNKRLQNEPQKCGSFHHVADIPCVIFEKWLAEELDWKNDPRGSYKWLMSRDGIKNMIKKKLRDPEWRWLKTTDKRV